MNAKNSKPNGLAIHMVEPGPQLQKVPALDPGPFMSIQGPGKSVCHFKKKQVIFGQGSAADAAFYIQKGRVKLTVLSKSGKEATTAVLDAGEFLGEECLSEGQPVRMATAIAISECTIIRVDRRAMLDAIRRQPEFSNFFLGFLLSRNLKMHENLIDQLFNSSEKRLARTLLLLAGLEDSEREEAVIPKISQETLAEMVGTTRSRISYFMNRFREQGFIDYDGEIHVRSTLANVLLRD